MSQIASWKLYFLNPMTTDLREHSLRFTKYQLISRVFAAIIRAQKRAGIKAGRTYRATKKS
jgi:hypothetical protein